MGEFSGLSVPQHLDYLFIMQGKILLLILKARVVWYFRTALVVTCKSLLYLAQKFFHVTLQFRHFVNEIIIGNSFILNFCRRKRNTDVMKTSAKNSLKRTSHGVARAIVKLNSLRSPSSIMAHVYNKICNL